LLTGSLLKKCLDDACLTSTREPRNEDVETGLLTPRPNSMARIALSWPIKSSSGVISAVQVNGKKDRSQRQVKFSAGISNRVGITRSSGIS
jgi:hypothetical protein